jgi:serine/threonine-protein kinase
MDPDRWMRVEALCEAALEVPADGREAFLDGACGADRELRREVESLLAELARQPSFLEQPLVDLPRLLSPNESTEPPMPERIGPYRLDRRLGRGGMGEVYLATREVEDLRQVVALKVIRRGMDTDEVLQRFRLERRILANLHHPHIAQLLDAAATAEGRPYFVMEYVEGVPLTDFCDGRRLRIRDRLTLFQLICRAVQHAHQNLVVHRDLKPSNILVSADGVPKLLDFGIGKVLTASEAFGVPVQTAADARLLTPDYAAPEQVRGGPVTTATDVYSLGVMLYELLCGHHPYGPRGGNRQEAERAALEATPNRPSLMVNRVVTGPDAAGVERRVTPEEVSDRRAMDTGQLRRRLAGDLDNIVLMALRKEPSRRYPSASALADDIQRHLDGLPVAARPDTLGYRLGKFVRRNVAAVAAVVVAFVALVAVTAVTVVQSRRVARESERVAEERDKALEIRGLLMEMFGATRADQTVGDTVTARGLLDLQAAQLKTQPAGDPALRADIMEVLADGYDRMGLYQDAEPLAREALALRRRLLGERHPDYGASLNLLGWILHQRGQHRDAEPLLREAVAVRRQSPRLREDLSRSLNDLGVLYTADRRYAEAETVLAEALAIRRAARGDAHRTVGITANNLAAVYFYRQNFDAAVGMQALALESLRQSVGPDHQRSVIAQGNLAAFRARRGDLRGAEADYRDLLARQTRLQGRDHPVTGRMIFSLAGVLGDRGLAEQSEPLLNEAEALYREATTVFESRLGASHIQVAQVLHRLAGFLLDRGRPRDALPPQRRAVAVLRAASGESHSGTLEAVARLALIRWRLGEQDAALRLQRDVVARHTRARGPTHSETGGAWAALCSYLLARPLVTEEARDACGAAERAYREAPPAFRRNRLFARLRLAQAHIALGSVPLADSLLVLVRPAIDSSAPTTYERRLRDSLAAARAKTGS